MIILFYIYTYKRKNEFITYLTIKDLKSNEILQNVCGNISNNKDDELSYNESLTNDIKNNTLDYIFNKIITDIDKNISELSKLYYDIALECKQKYYIPNTDITRAKKLRKYQILYRNSFIITSVILKDEDTSIANLKKC